jgi:hypothetical protein
VDNRDNFDQRARRKNPPTAITAKAPAPAAANAISRRNVSPNAAVK